jgi:DEAD/DEAH box helicase domain-containing protein
VWSLSYEDVRAVDPQSGHDGSAGPKLPALSQLPMGQLGYNLTVRDAGKAEALGEPGELGAFGLLGYYLSLPEPEEAFAAKARAYGVHMACLPGNVDAGATVEAARALADAVRGPGATDGPQDQYFPVDWRPGGSPFVRVVGHVGTELDPADPGASCFVPVLLAAELVDNGGPSNGGEKDYKQAWNGFWDLWNLMQFVPGFVAVSSSGVENDAYVALWAGAGPSAPGAAGLERVGAAWAELLSASSVDENALDEATVRAMEEFAAGGAPTPDELGYELESGEMAELAWSGARVCYLTADEADDREAFEQDGWTVVTEGEAIDAALAVLLEA